MNRMTNLLHFLRTENLRKHNKNSPNSLGVSSHLIFGEGAYIVSSFRCSNLYNTVEFEPSATLLESEQKGYVVASLGKDSGYVPYTAFCAKKSYIKENKKVLQGFTNALQKGMDYVQSHTPEEIAEIIKPQFKDADMETITTIVKRYAEQETWKENLIFEKESFELLQDILESADELEKRVPYKELVTTEFAKKAQK